MFVSIKGCRSRTVDEFFKCRDRPSNKKTPCRPGQLKTPNEGTLVRTAAPNQAQCLFLNPAPAPKKNHPVDSDFSPSGPYQLHLRTRSTGVQPPWDSASGATAASLAPHTLKSICGRRCPIGWSKGWCRERSYHHRQVTGHYFPSMYYEYSQHYCIFGSHTSQKWSFTCSDVA